MPSVHPELPRFEPSFPPGGPARVERRGPDVRLSYGRARLQRELAGVERLVGHPARPTVLQSDETSLLVPAFVPIVDPLAAVLTFAPAARAVTEDTRRAFLERLSLDVGLVRAVGRVGIKRKRVDRWLNARVRLDTPIGTTLGGVHPGFFQEMEGRAVTLRCERVQKEGLFAHDLAALTLAGYPEEVLREALPGQDPAAFDLGYAAVLLREHVLSDPHAAATLSELLAAEAEPSEVRVFLSGPSFLRLSMFGHRPGDTVSASRARFLMRALDGLVVAGERVALRTEPRLRMGKRTPYREPRAARRRRLFSRWFEGVQVDEEGLVGATPEALALRIAEGATGVVLDGTCGVGGLTIAHARQPGVSRVIAVDRSRERLSMMQHNAALYGVAHRVEPVPGDLLDVLPSLRADRLVLDPPWGGKDYDRAAVRAEDLDFPLARVLERFDGEVVLKLPRSFETARLPPGFTVEAMIDERSVLKFLVARRAKKS